MFTWCARQVASTAKEKVLRSAVVECTTKVSPISEHIHTTLNKVRLPNVKMHTYENKIEERISVLVLHSFTQAQIFNITRNGVIDFFFVTSFRITYT